jgi:hypothetical protein
MLESDTKGENKRSEQGRRSACMVRHKALSVNPRACDWNPKGRQTGMRLQILGNKDMEGYAFRDGAFHHHSPIMSFSNNPNDGQP